MNGVLSLAAIPAPAVPAPLSGVPWNLAIAAVALALACAALSPIVVARRWAFVGEGVSHSGFGGAGTIWLISLLLPGVAFLRDSRGVTLGVALFAIAAAMTIGKLTRTRRLGYLGFDAAVGIVLTASLAWGFLAAHIFAEFVGAQPAQAMSLLFGNIHHVGAQDVILAVVIAGVVLAMLGMFIEPVLAWAMDPELAEVSGTRSSLVHYGLLLALAGVIIVGAELIGVVLVTALLVLPGATAALAARRLGAVYAGSFVVALAAVIAAVAVRTYWSVPFGPIVVLALLVQFVAMLGVGRGWGR